MASQSGRTSDANRPWRKLNFTERRTAIDFARCMRDLVDVHCPKAKRFRVVLANLSTRSADAPYQTLPAEEAQSLLLRVEFHYVPRHASGLNRVEIGVLVRQCLDRRIESYPRLVAEIATWERQRNAAKGHVNWNFTTEGARQNGGAPIRNSLT